jgi:hypothetical protein
MHLGLAFMKYIPVFVIIYYYSLNLAFKGFKMNVKLSLTSSLVPTCFEDNFSVII